MCVCSLLCHIVFLLVLEHSHCSGLCWPVLCVACLSVSHAVSVRRLFILRYMFFFHVVAYIYSRCCNLKKQLTFHSVVRYWRQGQSLTLSVLVCLVTTGLSPSFTRKSTPSGKRRSARHSKIDWLSSPSSGTLVALTPFCWTWTSTTTSWRFWMQVCTGCFQH